MSPLLTVCATPRCGRLHDGPGSHCPRHEAERAARDQARRMGKPQREIWDSPRWRQVRDLVKQRDGFSCVDCGRHASDLGPNEKLLADHTRGVRTILAEEGDPFDLDELETRCSTCSGIKDGGLAR